jgi:hypothetical protein
MERTFKAKLLCRWRGSWPLIKHGIWPIANFLYRPKAAFRGIQTPARSPNRWFASELTYPRTRPKRCRCLSSIAIEPSRPIGHQYSRQFQWSDRVRLPHNRYRDACRAHVIPTQYLPVVHPILPNPQPDSLPSNSVATKLSHQ